MRRLHLATFAVVTAHGCASGPTLSATHAANPDAPSGPVPVVAWALHDDPVPLDARSDVSPHAGHATHSHDAGAAEPPSEARTTGSEHSGHRMPKARRVH